jgi:iron complex transport system substrate-binding protein
MDRMLALDSTTKGSPGNPGTSPLPKFARNKPPTGPLYLRYVMKRLLAIALTFSLALMLLPASPSLARPSSTTHHAFPVTVVDDLGNRVHLSHRPTRIVSLDPRDTETLFALGLEKRVVADGSQYAEGAQGFTRDFRYPSEWPSRQGRDYPVRSKSLPHIEGGFGTTPFDLEKIESLQPDVIFSLNSDAGTLQKMRDIGLKVIVLDPSNIKGIEHDIAIVGKATGTASQAARVIMTITLRIARVKLRLAHVHTHPLVYYEIDATNPTQPFTAGPGTFIDEALRLAGGRNVADGVTSCSGTGCYPAFSLETLVKLNPSIIILGDAAHGTTVAVVKSRSGWDTISAVQSGKIFPFDDDLVSRAGPRIAIGVDALKKIIHPNTH